MAAYGVPKLRNLKFSYYVLLLSNNYKYDWHNLMVFSSVLILKDE